MKRSSAIVLLAAMGAASAGTAAAQNILYDNGGFITHPGQGANGADVSQVDDNFFGLGNVVAWSNPGDIYRGADDFEVPGDQMWMLDRIRVYAFDQIATGQPVPPPPFVSIDMKVWDGDPRQPSSTIVATSTTLGSAMWTGAYRTEHGMLMQDTRPIYTAEAVFNEEELWPGTYWVDYQIRGGFAVTPYVKDGLLNAHGNALVLFSTTVGWAQTTYNGRGLAYPFTVEGSAIAIDCYANCDGSTTAPILNVDDFTCFINEFAAGQTLPPQQQIVHYANCDESTTIPVLNVDDFTCFINAYASCPL